MIEKLSVYCDLESTQVPDGYDMKMIPDITRENLIKIIDKQNEIIDALNRIELLPPKKDIDK